MAKIINTPGPVFITLEKHTTGTIVYQVFNKFSGYTLVGSLLLDGSFYFIELGR